MTSFIKTSSLVAVLWTIAMQCLAHEMRPAFVQLVETQDGVSALLRQPIIRGFRPDLALDLEGCRAGTEIVSRRQESTLIQTWQENCDQSLSQSTLSIRNMYPGVSEVLASITLADGSVQRFVIRPNDPVVALGTTTPPLLPVYLELGIEHLLKGLDHVLFVIALMVLITNRWRLVATLSAFTIAHSVTLALSTFDLVHVSQSAVEALIALSLLFMAVEMVTRSPTITSRYPWMIAFGFGLVHGLGFAGVLREVGLPEDAALWALLLFNLGIEVGQLMIILVCLGLLLLSRRLILRPEFAGDNTLSNFLPAYVIGPISVWWLLERLPILS